MKVAIIKYNAGNIGSVGNALRRIGCDFILSDNPDEIRSADRVIFPGVGEASTTMEHLRASGLDQIILGLTQPVLGICLGMQLMCSYSDEGETVGLGIFPEQVNRFKINEKVPHMGWNQVQHQQRIAFNPFGEKEWYYFVHSYYAELGPSCWAQTEYEIPFASALQKDNYYAVQFHPEKSAEQGALLLKKFIEEL